MLLRSLAHGWSGSLPTVMRASAIAAGRDCHHRAVQQGHVGERRGHAMQEPNHALDMQPGADTASARDTAEQLHPPYSVASSQSPLARYRSTFPGSVYEELEALFFKHGGPRKLTHAVDIGCSTGLTAVELARRGFRVTGIESDAHLLAKTQVAAREQHVHVNLLGAQHEHLAPGSVDLVTIMHGLHLLDPQAALGEVGRLLTPGGYLAAAWNDRDLTHPFVSDLEELLQRHNPTYLAASRQHGPNEWMDTLAAGGMFRLHSYTTHPHRLPLNSAAGVVDLFASMNIMRALLSASSAARKAFTQDVSRLVASYFGEEGAPVLPLESKLYIMKRSEDV